MRKKEACQMLGVTSQTLDRLVRQKKVHCTKSKVNGRRIYDPDDIRAYMAQTPKHAGNLRRIDAAAIGYEDRFTTTQTAKILGVTDQTVRRWLSRAGTALESLGTTNPDGSGWQLLRRSQIERLAEETENELIWPPDDQIILGPLMAAEYLGIGYMKLRRLSRDGVQFRRFMNGGVKTLVAKLVPDKTQSGSRWSRYSKAALRKFGIQYPEICPLFSRAHSAEFGAAQVEVSVTPAQSAPAPALNGCPDEKQKPRNPIREGQKTTFTNSSPETPKPEPVINDPEPVYTPPPDDFELNIPEGADGEPPALPKKPRPEDTLPVSDQPSKEALDQIADMMQDEM